jgi:predicted transcriptional regulator of viral defense system
MPKDIEQFETAPETDLHHTVGDPANVTCVLEFLVEHADQAFTLKELRETNDVPRGSIGIVLSRLEDRGLVRHRGDYWAVGDERAVRDALEASGQVLRSE